RVGATWPPLHCKRPLSYHRSCATAATTRSAGEAMPPGLDVPSFEARGGHVPQEERFAVAHLHVEHLVEIAVEHLAHPTDADGAPAHQALDGRGVEAVGEQFDIGVPLPVGAKVRGKTSDGLV